VSGAVLGIAVVFVVLAAGFYLTRGGGGIPGGVNDPAVRELSEHDALGDRVSASDDGEHAAE
jgi:hypothetical protein